MLATGEESRGRAAVLLRVRRGFAMSEMTRRDFLIGGPASLLGAAAVGSDVLSGGARDAEAVPRLLAGPVSVGYWIGGAQVPDVGRPGLVMRGRQLRTRLEAEGSALRFHPDVIAADLLPAGDPAFLREPVQLAIHGIAEAEPSWFGPALERLSTQVHFEVFDGGARRTLRYSAWHYDRRPVRNVSGGVRLAVPVDSTATVRLSLQRRDAGPGLLGGAPVIREGEVGLSAGREPGQPKLRRGVYFIAVLHASRPRPAWEQLQFREAGAGARGLVRRGLFGLEPADFDYLVVSVDRAVAAGADRA